MGNTHPPYTQEEKDRVIARLLPPSSESISAVSVETGISIPTLKKWRNDAQGVSPPEDVSASKLSSEQIFQIVVATATMNELQIGEYARTNGLYVQTIKDWAQNARLSNGAGACSVAKYRELETNCKKAAKENASLREKLAEQAKAIDEKNRVIAEQAAIIMLQKKTFLQTA